MTKNFQHILYEKEQGILHLVMNRPDVYNAMSKQTKLEIIEAITIANEDSEISSIVLTGSGKAFCSGQDLQDRTVQGGKGEKVDLGHTLATEWNPLVNTIRHSQKIIIAAINGVCAGAGISVALACDLLVSKPKVKFVSGFAQIGLCPDAGSSFTLVRRLGYQRALGFALLGNPLYAEDFFQVGLINALAEDEKQEALKFATLIKDLPPLAVNRIKKNFHFAEHTHYEESMEKELEAQRFLGQTDDYQEGLRAFFEKRRPQFQGK